ncbi:hypothetical protein Pmar_PMAR015079 [Perkinsus marinus ATCC 50983]|uniref:Uncharacterized protein n=1 Tax=Perkinsus marinus (strain ATCC 50983 / TXsc) TaxID=423536 RepID=C5KWG3_PERM5|nr:hypothetical protein Pmar_PMAR015079 [Perkinsus marinus ATCC 50983]EER11158.1 hypothetical protein Pmar_PMAR015079 [Perkinsus marinus ATCC 50983]|eukprot:XP_002779363.1 hypothetical protein Pmar_PMAR015079 [Perkinsus marinus ATCC 50983]
MRAMGHRYRDILGDLLPYKVEVFSSSKERAQLSAQAFVEGFFDGPEGGPAVPVRDDLLRPDSPALKALVKKQELSPEFQNKTKGEFAHLLKAFNLTHTAELRAVAGVIISNGVHDLPLPFTGRAAELVDEVLSAREWVMRRRFATLPIGRLGAGSLLRWLILSVEPKNVFIPDFADALAIELWDTGNSGNISTLWVGFHKHRYHQGKHDVDTDKSGAFTEGALKILKKRYDTIPPELGDRFGVSNVMSLDDLQRYSTLIL